MSVHKDEDNHAPRPKTIAIMKSRCILNVLVLGPGVSYEKLIAGKEQRRTGRVETSVRLIIRQS